MKLYMSPGACSLSPHIILRELGLPFELEAVNGQTKITASGADFKSINPKGAVPALQLDDGEVLTEGAAIVQFLADHYAPGKLAPIAGTVERARLTALLNYIASELHPNFGPLFRPATLPDAREAAIAALGRKFAILEAGLSDGRDHLLGKDYSLADAYLFVMLQWATMMGLNLGQWPQLQGLAERVKARPAVQDALAAEAQLKSPT
jgi:glutathione S-transferase